MSERLAKVAVLSIRRDDGRNSHARVTAGLLAALRQALPGALLELWAGANDRREIAGRGAATGLSAGEVATREVSLDAQWTAVPGLGRLKHLAWLARLAAAVRRSGAGFVVLADYGTRDLLRMKQLERLGLRLPPRLVVLHGGIDPPGSAARSGRSAASNYRAAIEWPGSPAIHYLALAPSAAATLDAEMPALAGRLHAIDLPELGCEAPPPAGGWRPGERIRVGFVGGTWGRKGFRRFVEMARAVRAVTSEVDFVLVGEPQREAAGYSTEEWRELSPWIAGLDRPRLAADEYEAEIGRLTYVSFLGDPESYARQASLTVVDAFRQCVPVLGLSNPLLRELATRVGSFGRFVDGVPEAARHLVAAAAEFPRREWVAQRDAMNRGRELFTPACLARPLGELVARLAELSPPARRR